MLKEASYSCPSAHGSISNAALSMCPTLSFPRCVHKSVLYICISIPVLQIHLSVPFFWIPYICVNTVGDEYAKIFKILGFRNKLLRPEYLGDLGDYLPIHSDLHFPPEQSWPMQLVPDGSNGRESDSSAGDS